MIDNILALCGKKDGNEQVFDRDSARETCV